MTKTIKLITFDLDDTLWENQSVLRKAEEKAYLKLCKLWPKTKHYVDKTTLLQLRESIRKERKDLRHQLLKLRELSLIKALEKAQCPTPRKEAIAHEIMQDFLEWRHDITLFPDVLSVLDRLSQQYTLGAITNGNTSIERLPISPYINFSLRAQDYNSSKPEPTLFLKALEKTGMPAEQTLHIGDCLKADVEGAQKVGIRAVWFNPSGQHTPDNNKPDYVVQSHLELLPLLEQLKCA